MVVKLECIHFALCENVKYDNYPIETKPLENFLVNIWQNHKNLTRNGKAWFIIQKMRNFKSDPKYSSFQLYTLLE